MPQTHSDKDYIYSVDIMLAYLKNNNYPITKINVNEYIDTLKYPGCRNPANRVLYSPIDVINNPRKYHAEYKNILRADLSYPIIVSHKGYIVDGIHRLSKAHLQKVPEIKAYVFDQNLMNKFIIAEI